MDRLAKSDPDTLAKAQKQVPLGRWGRVRDIADGTVYIFSDAGSFVNGQTLVVDGGSWRIGSPSVSGFEYPDFITSGASVQGVKGGKRTAKL